MMRPFPLLAFPTLALLAACGSQDNATTRSETATVPDDDGAVTAPVDRMNGVEPESGSAAPADTPTMPTTAPDAGRPGQKGSENAQGDADRGAPGPVNPPTDDAAPPPPR